jgi:hypothetical protein
MIKVRSASELERTIVPPIGAVDTDAKPSKSIAVANSFPDITPNHIAFLRKMRYNNSSE